MNNVMDMDLPKINEFELPKWLVITPHTKHNVSMKSLLVQQEETLKSSALSTVKMLELINKIVYDCIDERKAPFDNIENFMKNITMADRETLIFGLVVASYGEEQDFNVTCNACSKTFTEKSNLVQNLEINLYNGKEPMLKKDVDVVLPVSKATAVLRMPTLWDEYIFANSKGISQEVIRKADDYLVVKALKLPAKDSKDPEKNTTVIMDNVFDIYAQMRSMPARDRKTIYKAWTENFGEYGTKVLIPTLCPHCGNRGEMNVSMISEMFRQSQ